MGLIDKTVNLTDRSCLLFFADGKLGILTESDGLTLEANEFRALKLALKEEK